jgi:NADH-quinone oxidoreductase subunit L
VQDLAAVLGGLTLLAAGLIALVQTDIKRVIAYSTMSQIGYMFVGVGLGAYASGMFHLLTHAFFKALLFLAAGVVIHALAGEQDMRRMGGLRRLMPFTYWCFVIGSLALVGIPPFAGFFSKDPILAASLDAGTLGAIMFAFGIAGTFLTGLYTFRMLYLVFHGDQSAYSREHYHAHDEREGALTMLVPVAALGVLSVIGGWIQFAPFWTPVSDFLDPVAEPLVEPTGAMEAVASICAVALGLAGIAAAWSIYIARRWATPQWTAVRRALEEKLYWDRLYDRIFYAPADWVARASMRWFERPVIAGSATGIGVGARESGELASEVQTGYLRAYALALAAGLAVLVLVFISVR